MTTEEFVVDLDSLDGCRRAIHDEAGKVGGIGDGFAVRGVPASPFGTLDAAIRLAGAVQDLHTVAGAEFSAAHHFLRGVGHGLGDVGRRVYQTDVSNADAFTALLGPGVSNG